MNAHTKPLLRRWAMWPQGFLLIFFDFVVKLTQEIKYVHRSAISYDTALIRQLATKESSLNLSFLPHIWKLLFPSVNETTVHRKETRMNDPHCFWANKVCMFKQIKSKLNSYKEAFFEFYGDISNDDLYIVNMTNTSLYPQKT